MNSLFKRFYDFGSIDDIMSKRNTNFDRQQLIEIASNLKTMRNSPSRTVIQALAIYLFWLKTGLDQNMVATHFDIDSQFEISRIIAQVRVAFKDFVKENLGVKHLTRDQWLLNNSKIAHELFATRSNQFIGVADGTYCEVERSANNKFQRKTYSGQKKKHLVKPFVLTASNGKIIDIYGLHPANVNDATILSEIMKKEDLIELLQPGDILILDRGFRDCIEALEDEYQLITKMPACKAKNQKQLSTLEANQSRLVTKCRWVIEVTNSFLKNSFKALDGVKNKSLPYTLDDYKIAAALINRYFKRLYSDNDNVEIAKSMKAKLFEKNSLEEYVKENRSHRKSLYYKMDGSSIIDFPKLSKELIQSHITFGSYQLKQSASYLDEHLKDQKYEILLNKEPLSYENGKLLYAQIQSRHRNAIKYK